MLHRITETVNLLHRGIYTWCDSETVELLVVDRHREDLVFFPKPLLKFAGLDSFDTYVGDPAGEMRIEAGVESDAIAEVHEPVGPCHLEKM